MSVKPFFNDYLTDLTLSEDEAKFVGIEVNPSESQTSIPVVYGFRRVEPIRLFSSVLPTNTNQLICIYALSEGYCRGIDKIYIDGNDIGVNSSQLQHRTIVDVGAGSYSGVLSVEFVDGRDGTSATSTVNPGPSTMVSRDLSVNLPYTNLSYLVCKFTYSVGGPYKQLPKVSVDLFGRYIMNDITSSGPPPTFSYSWNASPVSVLLDMMTNTVYGAGISTSKIDTVSLGYLRTFFVANYPGKYQPSAPLWQTNWIMDTSQTLLSNIKLLLETYQMVLTYINGKYFFNLEQYPIGSGLIFNSDTIIGGITVQYPNQSNKLNRCTVEYIDPAINFQTNSITWPDNAATYAAYLSNDADVPLERRITSNMITRRTEAGDLAQMTVRRSRDQLYYTFRATKEAYNVRVGDTIQIQLDYPSINQEVIVTKMTMLNDFTFDMECAYWASGFYNLSFGANYPSSNYLRPLVPGTIGVQPPPQPAPTPTPPPAPTFVITSTSDQVNEGQTFTITITSSSSSSQVVDYQISGVSSSDINNASLAGSLTFSGTTCSLAVVTTLDATTEGNETFVFTARLKVTGQLIGTKSVTIIDSSVNPPPAAYWITIASTPVQLYQPAAINTGNLNPDWYLGPLNTAKTAIDTTYINTTGNCAGAATYVTTRFNSTGAAWAALELRIDLIDRSTSGRSVNKEIFMVFKDVTTSTTTPYGYQRLKWDGSAARGESYTYDPNSPPVTTDVRSSRQRTPSTTITELMTTIDGTKMTGGMKLTQTAPGEYTTAAGISGSSVTLCWGIDAGWSRTNGLRNNIPYFMGWMVPSATSRLINIKFFQLNTGSTTSLTQIGNRTFSMSAQFSTFIPTVYLASSRNAYSQGTGLTAPF